MSTAILRNVHHKYYGEEPDFSESEPTNLQLTQAYNWYNHLYTLEDAKGFVADYLKKIKHPKASLIHYVPASKLHSLGWNCRIILRGGKLPEAVWERATQKLDQYLDEAKPSEFTDAEAEKEKQEDKPFVSIQQRVANKVSELRSEIEEQIDVFINNQKSDFNVSQFFIKNEIKAGIAQIIADSYKPIYREIYDAVSGKDQELTSSYSYMSKDVLKAYLGFVKSIISTGEERASLLKQVNKKQRKKKEKPASVIVAKLQFKEKHEKLVSINPAQIVGSQQLWVYNIKYRTLSVYNAMGPAGLSVKGTTITGFDPKTSITKKLRKPEQHISSVLDGGKIVLRKLMGGIKTQGKEATGRINKDTLLMRVIR